MNPGANQSYLHDRWLKLPDGGVKDAGLDTQVLPDTQHFIAAWLLCVWDQHSPQCSVALWRERLPHGHWAAPVLAPNEVELPGWLDWRATALLTVIAVHQDRVCRGVQPNGGDVTQGQVAGGSHRLPEGDALLGVAPAATHSCHLSVTWSSLMQYVDRQNVTLIKAVL